MSLYLEILTYLLSMLDGLPTLRYVASVFSKKKKPQSINNNLLMSMDFYPCCEECEVSNLITFLTPSVCLFIFTEICHCLFYSLNLNSLCENFSLHGLYFIGRWGTVFLFFSPSISAFYQTSSSLLPSSACYLFPFPDELLVTFSN